MLKSFKISNSEITDHFHPNYYRFKKKLQEYAKRKDITSFALGDKDVIDVLTDGEHAGQIFVPSGALFIKNSAVKRNSISEFDGFYITHQKNNLLERSKLQLHDVLFTTIGKYLGVSSVVNKTLVGANINQNVVRIRLKTNKVSPQYLSCFLNSKLARFQIDNLFTGNTHPILTYPKIKAIKVFIKSKGIEKQVKENLIKAEKLHEEAINLIEEAKNIFIESLGIDFKKIEEKKHYKVDYPQFLTEDTMIPAFNYPLYVNSIKALKNVNHEILGKVADLKKGDEVGSTNYKLYLDREEGDLPFIRTTDFVNYDVDLFPDFFIEKEVSDNFPQELEPKDILYTNDGKIGLVAMLTEHDKCIIQSHIQRIRCHSINPYYLFIALITKEIGIYQAERYTVVQTTIPTIRNNLGNYIIPISDKLDDIVEVTKKAFYLKDKRKVLIEKSRLLIEESLE